jgi:hypothetical protein
VWLDIRKELTRFVTVKPEGEATVIMRVKYKKVPRYVAFVAFSSMSRRSVSLVFILKNICHRGK